MRKKISLGILILILATPLLMWVTWLITPNTKLVIAIVDKTVLTTKGQEHISLNWVLNHEKYRKTSKEPYEVSRDYFGFFPEENSEFKLKGLERFSYSKLRQLSNDADLAYFTDTYGIYNNEWFNKGDDKDRSGILYGGLSDKDIQLLELMKEKSKLIITEFNVIGSPTALENRTRFEEIFQLKWTGWTARYFDFVMGEYHLNGDDLYRLTREFKEEVINDPDKIEEIKNGFNQFRRKNSGILNGKMILPDSIVKKYTIN